MSTNVETFSFQAEAKQLLGLMIHSVYSNKDIFLRELISNSSDALDRRRFEAVQTPALLDADTELHICIDADPKARTLTIHDNGIGMSREEVIDLIGTIAKSGTQEFLKALQARKEAAVSPELIGQFGVGFYSVFMVADRVTLVTRRAGQEDATKWESEGEGTYTLESVERPEAGTSVTLHLREADAEDGMDDYAAEYTVRRIVKQYSDFVAYPIKMEIERHEPERDEEGKPVEGGQEKTVRTLDTLNSMKAIWLRDPDEVTEDEYKEFYHHISHDWQDPLKRIAAKIEGTLEYRMLLFIPSAAPFDLYMREAHRGVRLYIKRVFIMDDCKELLPEYLRFIRGVVDSEDLSLNISREILQQNRQIQRMRKGLINKALGTFKQMREQDKDEYLKFWNEFGRVLKEGLFQDQDNRDALLDLVLCPSTNAPSELTSLAEYVDRMKPEQEAIYYMTGESRKAIERSPHIEAFRDKGYEVLIFADRVDEVWLQGVFEYKDKLFRSVGHGAVELGTEDEKKKQEETRKEKEKEFASLLECLKSKLEEDVKEVRLSSRLTESVACLVGDTHDMSPQLEQMMKAMGQEMPKVKRILELNPNHAIVAKLQEAFDRDDSDPALDDYAHLLYGQALLAEGAELPDPGSFSRLVADLMIRAL
jgi:molecular chaperone HtpG